MPLASFNNNAIARIRDAARGMRWRIVLSRRWRARSGGARTRSMAHVNGVATAALCAAISSVCNSVATAWHQAAYRHHRQAAKSTSTAYEIEAYRRVEGVVDEAERKRSSENIADVVSALLYVVMPTRQMPYLSIHRHSRH